MLKLWGKWWVRLLALYLLGIGLMIIPEIVSGTFDLATLFTGPFLFSPYIIVAECAGLLIGRPLPLRAALIQMPGAMLLLMYLAHVHSPWIDRMSDDEVGDPTLLIALLVAVANVPAAVAATLVSWLHFRSNPPINPATS